MSAHAQTPELGEASEKNRGVLLRENRVWDPMGDKAPSSSLFFTISFELSTPYMTVHVNGKLLRWIVLVSVARGDARSTHETRKCRAYDSSTNSSTRRRPRYAFRDRRRNACYRDADANHVSKESCDRRSAIKTSVIHVVKIHESDFVVKDPGKRPSINCKT